VLAGRSTYDRTQMKKIGIPKEDKPPKGGNPKRNFWGGESCPLKLRKTEADPLMPEIWDKAAGSWGERKTEALDDGGWV